jgi:hypothetical protein
MLLARDSNFILGYLVLGDCTGLLRLHFRPRIAGTVLGEDFSTVCLFLLAGIISATNGGFHNEVVNITRVTV